MGTFAQETLVENIDGNCVIITTLMPSGAGQQELPHFSYSCGLEGHPNLSTDFQWSSPLPLAPQQGSSILVDEHANATSRKAVVCFSHSPMFRDSGLPDARQNRDGCTKLSNAEPSSVRVLAAMDANVTFPNWAVKRTAHLGPLVMVKRSRGVAVAQRSSPLSEVEKISYQRELDDLRGQLKKANEMLAGAQHCAEEEFHEKLKQLEERRCGDERRYRREFQEALAGLREENEELTGRLKRIEESSSLAAVRERDKLQNEWNIRLSENESQWREHLRVSQQRWEKCMDEQVRQKHEALRQVQELAQVVEGLEETFRQVTREKICAEQERDALLASQSQTNGSSVHGEGGEIDAESRSVLEAEILALRRELKGAEGREAALMVQLEVCGNEGAAQEAKLERELQQTRKELENERRHVADLVKLYSSQVESLHQQLNDAMKRNKQLTGEIERLRR